MMASRDSHGNPIAEGDEQHALKLPATELLFKPQPEEVAQVLESCVAEFAAIFESPRVMFYEPFVPHITSLMRLSELHEMQVKNI